MLFGINGVPMGFDLLSNKYVSAKVYEGYQDINGNAKARPADNVSLISCGWPSQQDDLK